MPDLTEYDDTVDDAEVQALYHALATLCNGKEGRVVMTATAAVLEIAVVQASRDVDGLDAFAAIFREALHLHWNRMLAEAVAATAEEN